MTTGILGSVISTGSLSYTPTSNAKVWVYGSQQAGAPAPLVNINGFVFYSPVTYTPVQIPAFYVGAGQTITVTGYSNTWSIVSAIEEAI